MFLEMLAVPCKVSTSLHTSEDFLLLSFPLLWSTRMHLDMLVVVAFVATFVFTLLTMMDWLLLLLLSLY